MIDAPTTQLIAMMEVAERSIWATKRTIMTPIAATKSGNTCKKISLRSVGLTISGTTNQSAAR